MPKFLIGGKEFEIDEIKILQTNITTILIRKAYCLGLQLDQTLSLLNLLDTWEVIADTKSGLALHDFIQKDLPSMVVNILSNLGKYTYNEEEVIDLYKETYPSSLYETMVGEIKDVIERINALPSEERKKSIDDLELKSQSGQNIMHRISLVLWQAAMNYSLLTLRILKIHPTQDEIDCVMEASRFFDNVNKGRVPDHVIKEHILKYIEIYPRAHAKLYESRPFFTKEENEALAEMEYMVDPGFNYAKALGTLDYFGLSEDNVDLMTVKLAMDGNVDATIKLSTDLFIDKVPYDERRNSIAYWLLRANGYKKKQSEAIYHLSQYYLQEYIRNDKKKIRKSYERALITASEMGNTKAMAALVYYYLKINPGFFNNSKADEWLKKLLQLNINTTEQALFIGYLSLNGLKNYSKSYKSFEEILIQCKDKIEGVNEFINYLSEKNLFGLSESDLSREFEIAQLYLTGYKDSQYTYFEIYQDINTGVYLLTEASDKGHGASSLLLAKIYFGNYSNITGYTNVQKGIKCLITAINQKDAQALELAALLEDKYQIYITGLNPEEALPVVPARQFGEVLLNGSVDLIGHHEIEGIKRLNSLVQQGDYESANLLYLHYLNQNKIKDALLVLVPFAEKGDEKALQLIAQYPFHNYLENKEQIVTIHKLLAAQRNEQSLLYLATESFPSDKAQSLQYLSQISEDNIQARSIILGESLLSSSENTPEAYTQLLELQKQSVEACYYLGAYLFDQITDSTTTDEIQKCHDYLKEFIDACSNDESIIITRSYIGEAHHKLGALHLQTNFSKDSQEALKHITLAAKLGVKEAGVSLKEDKQLVKAKRKARWSKIYRIFIALAIIGIVLRFLKALL